MKFILPKDLQKFRYYSELLSEIHGAVELNRLSNTKKWNPEKKAKAIQKVKDFEKLEQKEI